MKRALRIFFILSALLLVAYGGHAQADSVTINPPEIQNALKNPLKGFRPDLNQVDTRKYNSIVRHYIKWNELEQNANDGVEKILDYCDAEWSGLAEKNSKVIPRVYINWDRKPNNEYWPDDLMQYIDSIGKAPDDPSLYYDPVIQDRLVKLITKLGEAWDNDPRVAWIQMGIVGPWGEQHTPIPDLSLQKLLGDAFNGAFKNKKVLVRRPHQVFQAYEFGWYWDRFAHAQQGRDQADVMLSKYPDRWETMPFEGEVGYGAPSDNPGSSPEETLSNPTHRQTFINWVRELHASGVGWIANYNESNADVVAGAEMVQKVFGYRFLLTEVTYPKTIQSNQPFSLSFKVKNTGAAPFYYDWPVELRLLDPNSYEVKWKQVFKNVDIRYWMPGEGWNDSEQAYNNPASVVNNYGTFTLDSTLQEGKYILALAILDPANRMPAVKFATKQYLNGGNHPAGYIGVNTSLEQPIINLSVFDDPTEDNTLNYND